MGAEKPTEMNERVEGEEQGVGKEPVKFKVSMKRAAASCLGNCRNLGPGLSDLPVFM